MTRPVPWLLTALLLWNVLPGVRSAQAQGQAPDMQLQHEASAEAQKKRPSFFHRPKKDSPAEQLFFARTLQKEGKNRRAEKAFLAIVHEWHDTREAATAQRAYAVLLERRRKYEKAFEEYQYLIDNFPGHFKYEDVMDRQFAIANYLMHARKAKFFVFPGIAAPDRALLLFEKIVENAPTWKKAPEAQFYIGYILEEQDEYEQAVAAYEVILLKYPKSEFAAEAAFRRAHCLYREANGSPRDETRCRRAIFALAAFMQQYPDSDSVAQARKHLDKLKNRLTGMYYDRAVYYDRIARRPQAALIAYSDFIKKFPRSERSAEVNKRIEALKALLQEKDGNNYD